MLIALVVMLLAFWVMSYLARRQQQRMTEEQTRRTEEALVPGAWVRTRAGFYGTVVEVDGDVVTLATPLGDESLWAKSAVLGAEVPPFASVEDEDEDDDEDGLGAVAEADAGPSVSAPQAGPGADGTAQTVASRDEDPTRSRP